MIRSILRLTLAASIGCFLAWAVINLTGSDAIVVIDQAEAEGPQFRDPSTLDIVNRIHRTRVCAAKTQRYVWRWTEYRGVMAQQVIPLLSTSMPFIADTDTTILTLPNPGVPIDSNNHWFYRSITSERCGWMPSWLEGMFGSRVFRSADLPVNFVGDPNPPPAILNNFK